jgi:hypothetical protein
MFEFVLFCSIPMKTVTTKQLRAIAALLQGRNHVEAAAAARVTPKTLREWIKQAAFQRALRAARQRALDTAIDRLHTASGKAVRTLVKCLKAAKDGDRIRAANSILQHSLRAMELRDLAERISILEGKQP